MGFMDYFSDLYGSLSIQTTEAEEPQKEEESEEEEGGEESKGEESGKGGDDGEDSKEDGGEDGGDGEEEESGGGDDEEEGGDDEEEEEEEEEEDEPEDIKEKLEADCMRTTQCAPLKREYDECSERVKQQQQDGEAKEDCVEEFMHMMHCATACAAPKLWRSLA